MPDAAAYQRAIIAARTAGLRISAQATAELLALLEEYANELAVRVAIGLASRTQGQALQIARAIIRDLSVDLARATARNVRISADRVAQIHADALAALVESAGPAAVASVSLGLGGIGVEAAQAVLARPELAASFRSIRRESVAAVDRIIKRAVLRGVGNDALEMELRAHIIGADAFPTRLLLDRRRIGYAAITELGYEPTPANLAAVRADVGKIADRARLIARTEPMNAEWEAAVRAAADSDVVAALEWRVSNSRPEGHPGAPCPVCRTLAETDFYGLGPGRYHPRRVPVRPHPRCLCRLRHILLPPEEWGRRRRAPRLQAVPADVAAAADLTPSQARMLENAIEAAEARQLTTVRQPTPPGSGGGQGRPSGQPSPPPTPGQHSPQLAQALERNEAWLSQQPQEHAVVLAQDGTELLRKTSGAVNYVSFTASDAALMRDALLTHNHPTVGSSFSPDDILLAVDNDLAEIRAVDGARKQYVYSMVRPGGGWNVPLQDVVDLYNLVDQAVTTANLVRIQAGQITPDDASYEHHDVVWSEIARRLNWMYRKLLLP